METRQATVALAPCESYEQAQMDQAVATGVALLGGISRFVSPREQILLKPNLLSRVLPQRAVTTHPAVFSAVCRLLREKGYAHLTYGDSPGNITATPEKAAEAAAFRQQRPNGRCRWGIFPTAVWFLFPRANAATALCCAAPCSRRMR